MSKGEFTIDDFELKRDHRETGSASDFVKPLKISIAAVAQHLQFLEESGLVRMKKIDRGRICQIEPSEFSAASHWIADLRALRGGKFDRLGDLIAESDDMG